MKTKKLSMKVAITVIAGVTTLIGIMSVAYLTHKEFEKAIVSQTQQELLTIAKAIATSLEEYLIERSKMLAIVSMNPLFQKEVYEKKRCDRPETTFCALRNLYEVNIKDVDALTLLDANGIMLHRDPFMEDRPGMDHTDQPGVAYVAREHKPYISEVFHNNLGNLAISILDPIFYKDEFAGIVRWMIETDTISKRFVEPVEIGKKGFAWMFDNRDVVLSHPRKDFIGMPVLYVIKKMHKERGEVFDESRTQEHIRDEHDYLNRVKAKEEGVGIFINCVTDENDIVAYKRVSVGNLTLNLIISLSYSEIIGPIYKHARNTFGIAGFVILLLGAGGLALFRSEQRKAELETKARYLKQISDGAEALRKSEERFREFVEGTDDLITRVDSKRRFVYVNDTAEKIFGLNQKECIGLSAFDFTHPDDRERTRVALAGWVRDGATSATLENRQVSRTGQVRYMHWTINLHFDEDNNLTGINSIASDLTDVKLAQDALAAERERLEVTLRSIGDGVIATDSGGRIILANRIAEELTGWTYQEAVGKPLGDVFHIINEITRERCESPIDRVIRTGAVLAPEDHTVLIAKDGTERILAVSAAPILNTEGDIIGMVLVFRDITEKRKFEAQLQQAQKMEAIATLAGGIAHEFNNALVGISGNIELLQMNLPDNENIDRYVQPMKDSTHRMTGLTNHLLAYARGGRYQPKTVSLNDFVDETVPLIRHSIGPAVRVETDLPDDISHVEVDLTQMQMVLSAVLKNASEAMEGKGRIRIITRNEKIDEKFAKTSPDLKPGPYASLAIKDEGKGMDEETISKVFDPFFTTKFQGRGLGMAAAYGVIKNHGGAILLDSELGKGTVVRIYLPAVKVQVQQAKVTKAEMTTGTGMILVIEDEDVVIDVIRSILEELGYRILPAKTGREAVDIAQTFDGDIDLAILDIVLPDMSGNQIYPIIMEARPNLKVIVCSGYTINGPVQELLDAGAQGFIQKPFSFETLSEKLKEITSRKD